MHRALTIYFPYYEQRNALEFNLGVYAEYSEEIRNKIRILIVDDGSPTEPALPIIKQEYLDKLDISLYRIDVDIPWNQPGANNLAFAKAETEYVLRTDIDHYMDEANLRKLLNRLSNEKEGSNCCYFLGLRIEGAPCAGHINSFVIRRADYLRTNGYNESFSGNYGHDDIEFVRRLRKFVQIAGMPDGVFLIARLNAFTPGLSRDVSINKQKLEDRDLPHLTFVHKDKHLTLIHHSVGADAALRSNNSR